MDEGWIKLYRQIKHHWVFNNAEYLKAWITILIECNHKDNKALLDNELIACKRGQSLNSLSTWTKLFGKNWSIQKTRTFLGLLKNDKMINTQGLRKTTRLTVLKYDSYQDEQQTDNRQITFRQQADNIQVTTNKNVKNDKKEKNKDNGKLLFGEFIKLTKDEHLKLIEKYELEFVNACVERLDNYIGSTGKKYKSHYRTILSWVAQAEMKTGEWIK